MVTKKFVIVAKCDDCGWYGLLEECNPCGHDHDRAMCPECNEDVDSRQIDYKIDEVDELNE
jgi:hypothetical protein